MADFSSTVDSNRIFVPFEFKLENLEHLTNILDELKKASADLPKEAIEGMGIPRKGGGGTPPSKPEIYPGSTKEKIKDPEAAKVVDEDLQQLIDDLTEEVSPSAIQKKVEDTIDKIGESGIEGDALNMIRNPKGFIMGLLANPAVAAALIAAGYLTLMLEISMMQSGVLDKHFKRIVTDEYIKSVRPLERRMTQVGLGRQVIFTSESGSTSPGLAFNSYDAIHRGQIDQVDAFQIRSGYKW